MAQSEEIRGVAIAPADEKASVVDATTAAPSPPGSDNGEKKTPASPGETKPLSGFFHWHEPGTSKEEKKLIFKLDWFLLSFSCLMYFLKQVCKQTWAV